MTDKNLLSSEKWTSWFLNRLKCTFIQTELVTFEHVNVIGENIHKLQVPMYYILFYVLVETQGKGIQEFHGECVKINQKSQIF